MRRGGDFVNPGLSEQSGRQDRMTYCSAVLGHCPHKCSSPQQVPCMEQQGLSREAVFLVSRTFPLNSPWRTQLYRHRVYGLAFELFHSRAVWRKSALGLPFVQKKRTEEHMKTANRQLTRCSVSSTSHLSGWPLSRRQETTGGWQGCGGKGTHIHRWWECKLVQPLWQTVWSFLRNTKIYLLYHPAIPFPTELKGNENRISISYRHPVFIATLFTTAKIWKQAKCPSTDEYIKQRSMLFSHEKRRASSHDWDGLGYFTLREISKTKMNIVWYYLHVESKKGIPGASLVVQWSRLWVFSVGEMGLILGWGTKVLHATWQKIKIKKLDKKANL